MQTLTQIEQATETLPLVGYTVFWRLSGVRIQHDDLKQELEQAGFEAHTPNPPTARKSLRRALETWLASRQAVKPTNSKNNTKKRDLIRVINKRDSEEMVFVIVAEQVDFCALGLEYGTDLRVKLNKKTKDITVTTTATGTINPTAQASQIAQALDPYWQEYRDLLLAGDLSRMMRDIITSIDGIALREHGGLYFVPITQQTELDNLRELISNISDKSFVAALPVINAQDAKQQLSQAIHHSMMDELSTMETDLQRFLKFEEEKAGSVKKQTIIQRLGTYQTVQAKALAYNSLLGLQQNAIEKRLNQLRESARTLLIRISTT